MKTLKTGLTENICIMEFRIIWGLMCMILEQRTEPIKPGMVFTIEPGIYIEEEKMGVRIENNLWITQKW